MTRNATRRPHALDLDLEARYWAAVRAAAQNAGASDESLTRIERNAAEALRRLHEHETGACRCGVRHPWRCGAKR